MAKTKTISYQRVKNLGNYESERLEMTLELEDGDNVEIMLITIQDMVILPRTVKLVCEMRSPIWYFI